MTTNKKIKKVLKSILFKHVPSIEEKEFIKENKKHWTLSRKIENDKSIILVETALTSPASLYEKLFIARTIEKKENIGILLTLNSLKKNSSPAYGIAKSFGLRDFRCIWKYYLNLVIVTKALTKTLAIIFTKRTGENLLALHIDDIHIGDLIYDTLIRYIPNTYTVDKLKIQKHTRLIFRAIINFEIHKKIFKEYKIKYFITSHNVYAEFGIPCRIANNNSTNIILKDMDVMRIYKSKSAIKEHFLKISNEDLEKALKDPDTIQKAEQYYKKRLNGEVDQIDQVNAYKGKIIYRKNEIIKENFNNQQKKIVLVMAHAFSDAPHVGGRMAFQDYYHWLKETIIRLSKNQEINIIVKPHPSSYMWAEKGAVEGLVSQLEAKNIYITPNNFSTKSLQDIADYIVTARGTAGLEFSGMGIPAFTCGEGYYSGFGIACENTDKYLYLEQLDKIHQTPPLSNEIIKRARVLLFLTFSRLIRAENSPNRLLYPSDDINTVVPQQYKEMKNKIKKNGIKDKLFFEAIEKLIYQCKEQD